MGGKEQAPDSYAEGGGSAEVLKALADIQRKAGQGQKAKDQLIVGPVAPHKGPKAANEEDNSSAMPKLDFLNAGGLVGGEGLGDGGGIMSGGGFGGASSPWDAVFSGLGRAHGAYVGNDPNTPFVPQGREKGDSEWMANAGGPIGRGVGSVFGFGSSGELAGQNVGATLADLKNHNIHNLGLDVSQNLPPLPGMQQPGWKGLVNGATGLPFGTLLGAIFH